MPIWIKSLPFPVSPLSSRSDWVWWTAAIHSQSPGSRPQISPFHRSGLRGPSFSLAVGLKCKCKADWDKASCLLREVQLSAWVMIKWWHWCCPVATKQHAERGPASCRLRSGQPPACWEGSSSQPGVISDNVRTLSQTGCQYKACILLMIFQLRTGKYIW